MNVENIVKTQFHPQNDEIVGGKLPASTRFSQTSKAIWSRTSEGEFVSLLARELTILKIFNGVTQTIVQRIQNTENVGSIFGVETSLVASEFARMKQTVLFEMLKQLRTTNFVANYEISKTFLTEVAEVAKNNTLTVAKFAPAPGIKMVAVADFDSPMDLMNSTPNGYFNQMLTETLAIFCKQGSEEKMLSAWNFLSDALPRTIDRYEKCLADCASNNLVDIVENNINYVSSALHLNKDDHAVFLTLRRMAFDASRFDASFKDFRGVLFSAFDSAAEVPSGTTERILSPDSKLSVLGLLESIKKSDSSRVSGLVSPLFVQATEKQYNSPSELFFQLSEKTLKVLPRQSNLDVQHFKHMSNDFKNLEIALSSPTPLKILICGKQGSGKSAALHTALPAERAFALLESSEVTNVKNGSLKKLRTYAPLCGSPVLLIDQADEIIAKEKDGVTSLIKEQADVPTTEVWVVSDIKKVPAEAMSAFDLVVTVPQMPLDQRLQLAQELFDDTYVAEQVAKTCVTPNEIQRLHHWSQISGQTQWKQLSIKASGLQQALVKAGTTTQELPLTVVSPSENTQGFNTVVGCDDIVQQAHAAISCFRNPEKFKKLGGKVPKGLLLTGAPGTGKTHLARAMAHEAGVPLVCASSSALARNPELIGVVFEEAKRQAPCILFLDEVDAIGATAEQKTGASADPQRQAILNRLLVELSGFDDLTQVLVIGATHRPHVLDSALKRSGRLGWNIGFENPRRNAREQLWKHYGKDMETSNVDWARVARVSVGMSPADIAEAVNRSALNAAMDNADCVEIKHILRAVDQVAWGIEGARNCTDDQIYNTAVHEAGHALLVWAYNITTIDQISVKPSNGHLGFVRHFRDEDKIGSTYKDMSHRVEIAFGGLVAEEVVLGQRSAGAVADLKNIRITIGQMFRDEGMGSVVMGADWTSVSPDTKKQIEDEELTFARERKENVVKLFENNKALIKMVANQLVSHREISGEEFAEFLANKNISQKTFLDASEPVIANDTGNVERKSSQKM